MNKGLPFYFIFFLFVSILGRFEIYSQEPLWKLASDYEDAIPIQATMIQHYIMENMQLN